MNHSKNITTLFYLLKSIIPRRLQLWLRWKLALRKRIAYSNVWPILEKAGELPKGWPGWPEQKQFALVLTHDVESARGQEKCSHLMMLEEGLGFRSSFNFVPKRYKVSSEIRHHLTSKGFEVGVHGLFHDGKLYQSRRTFQKRAYRINKYLEEWNAVGFRSPAAHHNLKWLHDLNIEYDSSTFDTDPFEPQSDGMGTIFPFWVGGDGVRKGYVELPYTLPQDHALFIIMQEKDISIWRRKLDWIVEKGGMALLNTHPDYMSFRGGKLGLEECPARLYEQFLQYARTNYEGFYWHALPMQVSRYFLENYTSKKDPKKTDGM